jgi:TPP-dependent indolepyruvate ferredoxin oxidoreductase alpha subunit
MLPKKGVKVIIINEECALEKERRIRKESKRKVQDKKQEVYYTISDSCVKCNECIEYFGCPAINAKFIQKKGTDESQEGEQELRYYIDETICTPEVCPGVCQDVCKNHMIFKTLINPHLDDKTEDDE